MNKRKGSDLVRRSGYCCCQQDRGSSRRGRLYYVSSVGLEGGKGAHKWLKQHMNCTVRKERHTRCFSHFYWSSEDFPSPPFHSCQPFTNRTDSLQLPQTILTIFVPFGRSLQCSLWDFTPTSKLVGPISKVDALLTIIVLPFPLFWMLSQWTILVRIETWICKLEYSLQKQFSTVT